MELGAMVCVPNGEPHCTDCPLAELCQAHLQNATGEIPVKKAKKPRRIEEKTVLIIRDGGTFGYSQKTRKRLAFWLV